jgi:hypothetical protein
VTPYFLCSFFSGCLFTVHTTFRFCSHFDHDSDSDYSGLSDSSSESDALDWDSDEGAATLVDACEEEEITFQDSWNLEPLNSTRFRSRVPMCHPVLTRETPEQWCEAMELARIWRTARRNGWAIPGLGYASQVNAVVTEK